MAFSAENYAERLQRATITQDSILTLSRLTQMYRSNATDCARVWEQQMSQAPEQRVLPLLYVVNDVMQQSRKRGPQFLHAFGKVLERGMALARDRAPGKASSLLRLCGIWQERQVFKPDYCDQLRRIVNGEAAPAAAAPPGSPQTPPISPIVSSPPASPSVSAAAPSSPASARAGRPEPVAVDDAGASVVAAGDADADAEADMASSSATLSSSIARVQELSGSTAKQLSEVLRLSANTPGLLDGTCALPATRAGLVQLQAQAKQAEAAVAELRRLLRREVAQRSNLVLLLQAAATEQEEELGAAERQSEQFQRAKQRLQELQEAAGSEGWGSDELRVLLRAGADGGSAPADLAGAHDEPAGGPTPSPRTPAATAAAGASAAATGVEPSPARAATDEEVDAAMAEFTGEGSETAREAEAQQAAAAAAAAAAASAAAAAEATGAEGGAGGKAGEAEGGGGEAVPLMWNPMAKAYVPVPSGTEEEAWRSF